MLNVHIILIFAVLITSLVSSYGVGRLVWTQLAGPEAGRKFTDVGWAGGLLLGSLLTLLVYRITIHAVLPAAPDRAAAIAGDEVLNGVLPFALISTFVGTQLVMGVNVMLRSHYRANIQQQLNRQGQSTQITLVSNLSLGWSVLAMPLWIIWFWRFIRAPIYLWAYRLHGRTGSGLSIPPDLTHFWIGIVYGGAAVGLVCGLLWQRSSNGSSLRLRRALWVAAAGSTLWLSLFILFGFLIPLIEDPRTLDLADQWPPLVWAYIVLHLAALSVSTGPAFGLVLQLKPWTTLQKTLLGGIWGALTLSVVTILAYDNVLRIYLITPLPLGLRALVSILLISGCLALGGYGWHQRCQPQTSSLGLAVLGLAIVALLGLGLSAQLTLSPVLSEPAQLWLTRDLTWALSQSGGTYAADSKWMLMQRVWRSSTPLGLVLLWGAFLGSLTALVGARLQRPATEQANVSFGIVQRCRDLLQVWSNHSRVWWWMVLWSSGWLLVVCLLTPWQDMTVLWPDSVFSTIKAVSLAGREEILEFGSFSPFTILEVIAIATFLGALVGLAWQTTRQHLLFATQFQSWDVPQCFSAGVFATAVCGGCFGLGWLSIYLAGYLSSWFSPSAHGGLAWLNLGLYLLLHAALMGWMTVLLGHAFDLHRENSFLKILVLSALFMAAVCGVWAILQHQTEIYTLWIQNIQGHSLAQRSFLFRGELSDILWQTVRGGAVGAVVGMAGYGLTKGLPALSPTSSPSPRTERPSPAIPTVGTSEPATSIPATTDIVQQARLGEAGAIAQLLNRQLKSRQITARVYRRSIQLQILLVAERVPPQQALTQVIQTGLRRLQPQGIEQVRLIGKQQNSQAPAWQAQFPLNP